MQLFYPDVVLCMNFSLLTYYMTHVLLHCTVFHFLGLIFTRGQVQCKLHFFFFLLDISACMSLFPTFIFMFLLICILIFQRAEPPEL